MVIVIQSSLGMTRDGHQDMGVLGMARYSLLRHQGVLGKAPYSLLRYRKRGPELALYLVASRLELLRWWRQGPVWVL